MVGGWWSRGRVLKGCPSQKKEFLRRALAHVHKNNSSARAAQLNGHDPNGCCTCALRRGSLWQHVCGARACSRITPRLRVGGETQLKPRQMQTRGNVPPGGGGASWSGYGAQHRAGGHQLAAIITTTVHIVAVAIHHHHHHHRGCGLAPKRRTPSLHNK